MNKVMRSGLMAFSLLVAACGGGGGGTGSNEPPPPTQPTAISVQLSAIGPIPVGGSIPAGSVIKDIYAVITLPANVTVTTANGAPVVQVSLDAELKFTPTLTGSDLTVHVSSTDSEGISPDVPYATISCTYTGASAPAFSQPTNVIVAGGPPDSLETFVDLGMDVQLTVQ